MHPTFTTAPSRTIRRSICSTSRTPTYQRLPSYPASNPFSALSGLTNPFIALSALTNPFNSPEDRNPFNSPEDRNPVNSPEDPNPFTSPREPQPMRRSGVVYPLPADVLDALEEQEERERVSSRGPLPPSMVMKCFKFYVK